jgi:NitT/TauT family transport system substrate-binding protein
LGASYNKFPYSFVVKSDIRSPKDLRGRKVGILNFGGSNDLALQLAFKEWGIKLNEVTILLGGDAPTRLQSLLLGRIDAAILSPPHLTKAVQAGYRVLADMGEMTANFPQSSLYVKGSLIKENRDRVKRFVRAYAEATHVIRTDKARTQRVFSQRMRLDDKEMLNTTYDYFAPRFSFPPRINMAGVRDTYAFYAEKESDLRGKTGEEFIDNSVMDELEKEGFFKKLGGS